MCYIHAERMDLEDNTFMLPGPVKIHPRVLKAMAVPTLSNRGAEFSEVNKEIKELLQYLFQTRGSVAVISGSGTAGMEAALASVLRKGDKVLNIMNGKFGERLHEISRVFADATPLEFPWGKAADVNRIAEALDSEDFKALTLCHNETSTAVTNPAREIAHLARKKDILFIVDGITSVGGIEVKPDEWGFDITILGSQKCIAAPAGLAALCVSKRAEEEMHDQSTYYLNLKKHIDDLMQRNQTPYTPAIPLFLALREALRMVKEEGLENRIARISKLANATRDAVDALGLEIFPDRGCASNTVTAIKYPKGIEDAQFRKTLREVHRVVIAGAQDRIKGKVFRIGHMGICSFTDLLATFGAIESTLKKMGYQFESGKGVGAIEAWM